MVEVSSTQRISRLTPLNAVLERIDAQVEAVKLQRWAIGTTEGYTLAEDVIISSGHPEHAIALRDGFAVASAAIADAGPYAPVPLLLPASRVDVGQALPNGTDAVLPLDAVTLRGDQAEALAPVSAGEGVLAAGGDAAPHAVMRCAGERMRSVDIAAIQAAGIKGALIRQPRIAVVIGGEPAQALNAVVGLFVRTVFDAGATVSRKSSHDITLESAISDADNEAIIAIGGTGSGRSDAAVQTLARVGQVEVHGIAISPGETAAFGYIGARPVLLIPGRLDAALAVWLLIGRHLVAKLAGGNLKDMPLMLPLKRKVTSTIGLVELIPVGCSGGMAEPFATGYLSFASLTHSDGWLIVPAESEGFAAGTAVAVNPWP